MGETNRSTWKKFERSVARFFGAERTALSGSNSKISSSDSTHDRLYIECKLRNENDSFYSLWNIIKSGRLFYTMTDDGLFFLMHISIYKEFCADFLNAKNPPEKLRLFKRFRAVKGKARALITLYKDSKQKADIEGKIPFVARKVKNKKGWAIFFEVKDLETIFKESEHGEQ